MVQFLTLRSTDRHGHQAPSRRRQSDERAAPAAQDRHRGALRRSRARRGTLRPPQVSQYPDPVTEGARRGAEEPPVKWLTAAELDSWLSLVRLMTWLPWSIDQQLQRDSNLGIVEYQVLAMLSDSPERMMRLTLLAEVTNASLSRLSHLVKRLEERGLARREPDHADGRLTHAILTG